MKSKLRLSHLCIFVLAIFTAGVGSMWTQTAPPTKMANDDNAELKVLFLDDQHDRGVESFVQRDENGKLAAGKSWPVQPMDVMEKHDHERRARVRQLLDAGSVKTGQDYWFAAMVFQHGDKPEDYLMAHVLSVVSANKGNRNGRWLAAASLDRYLLTVGQKQIYGTQFTSGKADASVQIDYDTGLLNDNLRAASCVIPYAQQHKQWMAFQSGGTAESTTLISCLMSAD